MQPSKVGVLRLLDQASCIAAGRPDTSSRPDIPPFSQARLARLTCTSPFCAVPLKAPSHALEACSWLQFESEPKILYSRLFFMTLIMQNRLPCPPAAVLQLPGPSCASRQRRPRLLHMVSRAMAALPAAEVPCHPWHSAWHAVPARCQQRGAARTRLLPGTCSAAHSPRQYWRLLAASRREGNDPGHERTVTYQQMLDMVCQVGSLPRLQGPARCRPRRGRMGVNELLHSWW